MKKNLSGKICTTVAILGLICVLCASCSIYAVSKDTVLHVGNGRYQVLHGHGSYLLVDNDRINGFIDDDVKEYHDEKKINKLYIISSSGYIVVDYDTCVYEKHAQIADFPESDQVIFQDKAKFTAFGEN